jgi:hypothetical protein
MAPRPNPTPIKLSAKLPNELALNGLGTVHAELTKYGTATVVMTVSASEVTHRLGGSKQPTVTIKHIEGLPPGVLADQGKALLRDARAAREGADGTLPGMGTDELAEPAYEPGTGQGAGWND